MDHAKFFEDLIESKTEYKKNLLKMFIIKNDGLIKECCSVKFILNRV